MSRIGRKPLYLPDTVKVEKLESSLKFTGPKGTLESVVPAGIKVEQKDNVLNFTRESDIPDVRALHGLARRLAQNCVTGVTEGFEKDSGIIPQHKGVHILYSHEKSRHDDSDRKTSAQRDRQCRNAVGCQKYNDDPEVFIQNFQQQFHTHHSKHCGNHCGNQ